MSGDDLAAMAAKLSGSTTPSRTSATTAKPRTPAPPPRTAPPAVGDETAKEVPPVGDTAKDAEIAEVTGSEVAVQAEKPSRVVTKGKGTVAGGRSQSVAAAAAGLAPPPGAGNLLSVRTQPPATGEWANRLMDAGQYALDCRQGDIMGAVLLIAMQHSDEVVALLEAWRGVPTDTIKAMVWQAWKTDEDKRVVSTVQVVDEG